ncbi:MAG: nucleotide disphospho-sugar-binding domain-containing protein [Azonexus sp.]
MSRVLIAWELGTNYGHLARCLAIAHVLRERGHVVMFAVRDTRGAAEILSSAGFPYLQAPMLARPGPATAPPASYSEILLGAGYGDRPSLKGMVTAWVELLRLFCADVVLADHAPTALIAARILDVTAIAIGNGFSVPPPIDPMPSFRPWENIPEGRLLSASQKANETITHVFGEFGVAPVQLAELFSTALLDTFPELDHYGERAGACYIGPIFTSLGAQEVRWQHSSPTRIAVYMRPDVAGFPFLLEALRECDAEVLAIIPGLGLAHLEKLVTDQLRIYTSPVAWRGLLTEANLVVGYGGTGSVAQSLLAGVPQLMLPRYIEQHLGALRVEAMGAGITIGPNRNKNTFVDAIQKLLSESRFKAAAMAFAGKYASHRSQSAVMKIVASIEENQGVATSVVPAQGESD